MTHAAKAVVSDPLAPTVVPQPASPPGHGAGFRIVFAPVRHWFCPGPGIPVENRIGLSANLQSADVKLPKTVPTQAGTPPYSTVNARARV